MKCELKSLKVCKFASHETTCYEAKLFIDGVFAAHCSNDGQGGSDNIQFKDRALEARFLAFAKAETGATFEPDAQYIARLMDAIETAKWNKRICKNKIVFRLVGDPEGQFRTNTGTYTPERGQALRDAIVKRGLKLDFILNEKIS
jgi:hypothetical protein